MNSQREKRSKGSVPFGYDIDPEDSSYVIPNPEQLDVLQNVELVSPVYYIVAGLNKDEGIIITRERNENRFQRRIQNLK